LNGRSKTRWRGLLVWAALIVLVASCGDSKSHLVEVDGWMGQVTFSQDGRYLIGIFAQFTEGIGLKSDTFSVYEVRGLEKVMSYQSPGRISGVFTCGDPGIVLHGEDKDPEGEDPDLVFRSISTKEEIAVLEVDRVPFMNEEGNGYFCDFDNNVMYLAVYANKIIAVDGSTGEILREYLAENLGDYTPFFVQKGRDRLVWVDEHNEVLWVYRLSDASLLQRVDLWPDDRTDSYGVHFALLDDDHLAFGLLGTKDDVGGAYLEIVDLELLEVEKEYYLGPYDLHGVYVIEPGDGRITAYMHEPNEMCGQIWLVDTVSEQQEVGIDLCKVGSGNRFGAVNIPELDLFWVGDWTPSSGSRYHVDIFSYPSFELSYEGVLPSRCHSVEYAKGADLIALASFENHFGVFDPRTYKMVDDFHICEDMSDTSLKVDPTGRYAAMTCGGVASEQAPESNSDHPRGAGFAVVDLLRYREE
jgi:hypothetical protein